MAKVAAELMPLIQSATRQTLAGIRVVDSRGVVVASSGGQLGLSLAARPETDQALSGKRWSLLRHRETGDAPLASASRNSSARVFVSLPILVAGEVRGAVVLSRSPMSLIKAFYQDRFHLLAMGLVLLGAVLLISLSTAAFVLRPVRALAARASAMADGRAAPSGGAVATREIAELSDAVTRMGIALQQRADTVRVLAANVSHEFKTPLTSLRGTVELLRDHLDTMDAEQRRRFLDILLADAARLGQLVERLLISPGPTWRSRGTPSRTRWGPRGAWRIASATTSARSSWCFPSKPSPSAWTPSCWMPSWATSCRTPGTTGGRTSSSLWSSNPARRGFW